MFSGETNFMGADRCANTLDAMVGHRSPRYQRFGWASARLDDVLAWIPARTTAALAAALAPLVGGSALRTLDVVRRDGRRHPSPNAGMAEAAFAGALGVRLGGENRYGDRVETRGPLGDGRPPGPADVARAVRLSRDVAVATLLLSAALPAPTPPPAPAPPARGVRSWRGYGTSSAHTSACGRGGGGAWRAA